mmetsp:Transcript_112181/g.194773  ORF Transcript_112181/g.194773 Transcript_112181/m.194773 type:complete len:468 (+) Transcript_112181:3060-4463(+)
MFCAGAEGAVRGQGALRGFPAGPFRPRLVEGEAGGGRGDWLQGVRGRHHYDPGPLCRRLLLPHLLGGRSECVRALPRGRHRHCPRPQIGWVLSGAAAGAGDGGLACAPRLIPHLPGRLAWVHGVDVRLEGLYMALRVGARAADVLGPLPLYVRKVVVGVEGGGRYTQQLPLSIIPLEQHLVVPLLDPAQSLFPQLGLVVVEPLLQLAEILVPNGLLVQLQLAVKLHRNHPVVLKVLGQDIGTGVVEKVVAAQADHLLQQLGPLTHGDASTNDGPDVGFVHFTRLHPHIHFDLFHHQLPPVRRFTFAEGLLDLRVIGIQCKCLGVGGSGQHVAPLLVQHRPLAGITLGPVWLHGDGLVRIMQRVVEAAKVDVRGTAVGVVDVVVFVQVDGIRVVPDRKLVLVIFVCLVAQVPLPVCRGCPSRLAIGIGNKPCEATASLIKHPLDTGSKVLGIHHSGMILGACASALIA